MNKYIITLRDTRNGYVTKIHEEYQNVSDVWYLWTEGNFGCDCNRLLKMYPALDNAACSDGIISLVSIYNETTNEYVNEHTKIPIKHDNNNDKGGYLVPETLAQRLIDAMNRGIAVLGKWPSFEDTFDWDAIPPEDYE